MNNRRRSPRPVAAAVLAALAVLSAPPADAAPAAPQQGIHLLIPNDDTCSAFVAALNSGDRATMLSLGGWALGYLSGIAQQSGKDVLHGTTSEGLMDRIAESCQRQPNRPMSAVVMEIANSLLAGVR